MAPGRRRGAADKQYVAGDAAGNLELATHGILATGQGKELLSLARQAVQLSPGAFEELQSAAQECEDQREIKRAFKARDTALEKFRKHFGELAGDAALQGDTSFFTKFVEVLRACGTEGQKIVDPVRHDILVSHTMLSAELGRDPAICELQEVSRRLMGMDERQLRRIVSELGLSITSQTVVSRLRKLRDKLGGKPTTVATVRKELSAIRDGKKLSSNLDDDELATYVEPLGIEFSPEDSVKAHHAALRKQRERLPSAEELLERLPDYATRKLGILLPEHVEEVCRKQNLSLMADHEGFEI